MRLSEAHGRKCDLGSPVREICTPGSAWGDEHKALRRLGEALARKGQLQRGSAKATAPRLVPTSHAMVRRQLMALVERRIGDSSIRRLIRKWIHVGVIEDGRLRVTQTGTGQGQVIFPLLANISLHYVLDEWFEHEVKPRLRGQAAEIRYADDCAPRRRREETVM
jgi:hypothetical protein